VFSVVGEILAPRREPEPPPRREPAAPRPNEIAAPSQGASSEPPRIEVTAPIWLARPRHPERRYPGEAFAAGVEGAVELDCEVDLAGKLVCSVIWESPAGWGFGEAALVLAGEHVMAPLQHEGAAALGRYRMRIPFTQSPR
jgi:protein TonB